MLIKGKMYAIKHLTKEGNKGLANIQATSKKAALEALYESVPGCTAESITSLCNWSWEDDDVN